jgi:uncharacterized protein (TIGR03066 family)
MDVLRLLSAWIVVCPLAVCARAEDRKENLDRAKLLVGKWDVTRGIRDVPAGSTIEFGTDGKMEITLRDSDQVTEERRNAVYKVKGDSIEYTMKLDPRKEEDPREVTIKKISERELVLEFDKDHTVELKRADAREEESPSAKLIVGQWVVTRGTKDLPVGVTIGFGTDGRMTSTHRENGREQTGHAVYKVKGDNLRYRVRLDPKPPGPPVEATIKKISGQELVLEFDKDRTVEFKRKK